MEKPHILYRMCGFFTALLLPLALPSQMAVFSSIGKVHNRAKHDPDDKADKRIRWQADQQIPAKQYSQDR